MSRWRLKLTRWFNLEYRGHVEVVEDHACVVTAVGETFKLGGKPAKEAGATWTLTFHQVKVDWKIQRLSLGAAVARSGERRAAISRKQQIVGRPSRLPE